MLYKEKIGVLWHRKEIPGRFNAWSRRPYPSRNFILFLNSFTFALWIVSGSGASCALGSAEATLGWADPSWPLGCLFWNHQAEYLCGMAAGIIQGLSRAETGHYQCLQKWVFSVPIDSLHFPAPSGVPRLFWHLFLQVEMAWRCLFCFPDPLAMLD